MVTENMKLYEITTINHRKEKLNLLGKNSPSRSPLLEGVENKQIRS